MPVALIGQDRQRPTTAQVLAQHGKTVLAADFEIEQPDQVVDPRHAYLVVRDAAAKDPHQRAAHAHELVAQANDPDARHYAYHPGQHRHRISQVQHPRLGTDAVHRARDLGHDRDVAERSRQPAGPDCIADRLIDAVLLRQVDVDGHRVQAAGGDGDDDKLRAAQPFVQVGGGVDREASAGVRDDFAAVALDVFERGRADVVEHDLATEVGRQRQITQQFGHPVVAATPNEADAGHVARTSLVPAV